MTQTKSAVKLKPLGNRVLVKRLEAEETLKGGINPPRYRKKETGNRRSCSCRRRKERQRWQDHRYAREIRRHHFDGKYSGQEITLDDEEYVIVRADDIIAIVEK